MQLQETITFSLINDGKKAGVQRTTLFKKFKEGKVSMKENYKAKISIIGGVEWEWFEAKNCKARKCTVCTMLIA